MIRVLVIDDEAKKRDKIVASLEKTLLADESSVLCVGTYVDAIHELATTEWDLVILDVQLPMREGQTASPRHGIDLLDEIQSNAKLRRPGHIIGLTAYDDLQEEYTDAFSELTWTLVAFDHSSDDWSRAVAKKIEHIRARKLSDEVGSFDYDLAVIVALEDAEMRAVLALEASWEEARVAGDDTVYFRGKFVRGTKALNVVAAASLHMGMPAATGLAMKLCARYRPRYLAMVGIAAGVNGGFGDILIADKVWDYGSGKIKEGPAGLRRLLLPLMSNDHTTFEPALTSIPLDSEILAKLGTFCRRDDILRQIESRWSGPRAPHPLKVIPGGMASGAAVLESRRVVERIKSHERKLVGVEMEAYGVFMAARVCPSPRPKVMAFKSICDFANSEKSNDWQAYAAFTSAQFLYEFALAEL